jgi:hypothetical protein
MPDEAHNPVKDNIMRKQADECGARNDGSGMEEFGNILYRQWRMVSIFLIIIENVTMSKQCRSRSISVLKSVSVAVLSHFWSFKESLTRKRPYIFPIPRKDRNITKTIKGHLHNF